MSENPTEPKKISRELTPREVCKLIRDENTNPWNWFYPSGSACTSCAILTGGHPEMMANFCPRVNAYFATQSEQAEPNSSASNKETAKLDSKGEQGETNR